MAMAFWPLEFALKPMAPAPMPLATAPAPKTNEFANVAELPAPMAMALAPEADDPVPIQQRIGEDGYPELAHARSL